MNEVDAAPFSEVPQRLAELGVSLDPKINYDLETVFPKQAGWGANRDIRKRYDFIRKVEPVIKRMLEPEEQVLYVAKGIQYSLGEQFFLGIWAQSINHAVFVLTNLRLLMLRTNRKGKPKEAFWAIFYSQIKKLKGTWHGSFRVVLHDGKKLKFTQFRKIDRKRMPEVFDDALANYRQLGFDPPVTQSMETLCSHCLQRVAKGEFRCRNCGTEFYQPSAIALRSLIFPCWGDLTMKHYSIALVELFSYAFTWLVAVSVVIVGFDDGTPLEGLIAVALILVCFHVVDAGVTYFVAKKGLYPKSGSQVEVAKYPQGSLRGNS